ncbi:MAG: ferrochelatase [Anaerolineae bacterium]
MSDPLHPIGVLVMAYGGPDSLDDIEPYLLDVRGGRPTRAELVEEIRERYRLIGGRSPIRELTEAQATALEAALNSDDDGRGYRTYVGMRHWYPYISEAVARMVDDGIQQAVGLVLAPHYSQMSIGAYIRRAEEARTELAPNLAIRYVQDYHLHPLYLDAVAERVTQARGRFPEAVGPTVPIIFTAHSLPERILASGDPYPTQLQATAEAVVRQLGPARWHFAYQSAGATGEPWLGPDVAEVVQALARQGESHVLVAPIGFVSDHVEILFDLDVELQHIAHEAGIHLERIQSLNDSPLFIAALADVVRTHVPEVV